MTDGDPAIVIAVDGPAASGKGTLARRIAEKFGFAYLDTGLLYRAVGTKADRTGGAPDDVARNLTPEDLADPSLRTDEAGNAASRVAALPEVRAALVELQRAFAGQPPDGAPGAVIDGRDIGTVICPDAAAKIYVDASVEVRAKRRAKELRERGLESIYARVLQDMEERDARDRGRAVSPLVPADDAFVLDTTELDADAAFDLAVDFITSRTVLTP